MQDDRKLVAFRTPSELYYEFKAQCAKDRKTVREVLTQLMLEYIERPR